MKIQKSLLDILPLHYWTGIFGGVIYIVWVGITFSWQSLHYSNRSFLVTILFTMVHLPTHLRFLISDLLIDRALENANGGSVYTLPYHVAGYIIPFIFFVLLGLIVGKTFKDRRRETIRRRVIVVLFGIVIIVCASLATIFVFVMDDL